MKRVVATVLVIGCVVLLGYTGVKWRKHLLIPDKAANSHPFQRNGDFDNDPPMHHDVTPPPNSSAKDAKPESNPASAREARLHAQKFYREWRGVSVRLKPPQERMQMMARLDELGPENATYFIQYYRDARGSSDSQGMDEWAMEDALQLVLCCGGPEATSLLVTELKRKDENLIANSVVMQALDASNNPSRFYAKLESSGELTEIGFALSKSGNARERAVSCTLLSASQTQEARIGLRAMASNDSEVSVRVAAIRGVARNATSEDFEYLQTELVKAKGAPNSTPESLVRELKAAVERLSKVK